MAFDKADIRQAIREDGPVCLPQQMPTWHRVDPEDPEDPEMHHLPARRDMPREVDDIIMRRKP